MFIAVTVGNHLSASFGCIMFMVTLPDEFLRWNYLPRRKALLQMVNQRSMRNMDRFFLESTRHNPALCTAFQREDGQMFVNAKIVGIGYVVKERYISEAMKVFAEHLRYGDELLEKARAPAETKKGSSEFQKRCALLLIEHLYFEDLRIAREHIDFGRMSTIELALSHPGSSKHTWQIVQHNLNACLLFYQPPSISFEVHGKIEIHEKDACSKFVNLVHDSFHYSPTRTERPVYIFHVEEVYDNGPSSSQFGKRIV
jgi:hypothetical protein